MFPNYLPLKKGLALHFNNFESPSPKDDLCQVWSKLAKWFLRRFLNDLTLFLHFCYYLPFEDDLTLHLNNYEFPSLKDDLCKV